MKRHLFWLLLSACGSEIVGDWFRCGETCEEHLGDGLRLREDETFTMLEADGSTLDGDEPYCELTTDSSNGTYAFEGEMLTTTTRAGRTSQVVFSVDGDTAVVEAGAEAASWSRVADRSTGACPRLMRR
jgi:hypothetical protein